MSCVSSHLTRGQSSSYFQSHLDLSRVRQREYGNHPWSSHHNLHTSHTASLCSCTDIMTRQAYWLKYLSNALLYSKILILYSLVNTPAVERTNIKEKVKRNILENSFRGCFSHTLQWLWCPWSGCHHIEQSLQNSWPLCNVFQTCRQKRLKLDSQAGSHWFHWAGGYTERKQWGHKQTHFTTGLLLFCLHCVEPLQNRN